MPVDKFGRMSDAKTKDRLLILITITFVETVIRPFLVL